MRKPLLLLHGLDLNLRSCQQLNLLEGQVRDLSRPDVQDFNRIDYLRSFC